MRKEKAKNSPATVAWKKKNATFRKAANRSWKSVALEERRRRIAAETCLTDDMARLVIAARMVAFIDQSREALKELDTASEAFASRVLWDDQPFSSEWDGISRCRECRTPHSPNSNCHRLNHLGTVK